MSEFSAEHPYSENFEKEALLDRIRDEFNNGDKFEKLYWDCVLSFYQANRIDDEEAHFCVEKGHLPDLEEWERKPEHIGVEPEEDEFDIDELHKPELIEVLSHRFELLDVGFNKVVFAWVIELYEGNRLSDKEVYDFLQNKPKDFEVDKW